MEHDFTLIFKLDPLDSNVDDILEGLGAAGCTDAIVGIGAVGLIALDFSREAISEDEAIGSAIEDVKSAIPKAVFVQPDSLEKN